MSAKHWIAAARPRTLPLSLACIGMGTFLAANHGNFNVPVFVFCILTTVLLQILSNLSNDYGDSIHGADSARRQGPSRAVQTGAISLRAMRSAILLLAFLAMVSGVSLLWFAFGWDTKIFLSFFLLGVLAIVAAITYTSGKKPYGYLGLGDLSVLIFFGLVGVIGTYFLHTKRLEWTIVLPALSCGLFSVAVLNLNNIRDIDSDRMAGKRSIPVRIGRSRAVIYHWLLLFTAVFMALVFVWNDFRAYHQLLFLLVVPLLVINALAVRRIKDPLTLDPYLKQLAMTTLLFVVTFGIGQLL